MLDFESVLPDLLVLVETALLLFHIFTPHRPIPEARRSAAPTAKINITLF
jgi:hypothetical protein